MAYRGVVTKKSVVHAGVPKTGTSAIPNWFHRNRDALAAAGIHYPIHDLEPDLVRTGQPP